MLIDNINTIIELENFMKKNKLFFLFFDTGGWSVGESVLSQLIELADSYEIDLVKIDTKKNRYISGQYSVFAVPTILLIYRGREYLRESRFIDFENIKENLDYLRDIKD